MSQEVLDEALAKVCSRPVCMRASVPFVLAGHTPVVVCEVNLLPSHRCEGHEGHGSDFGTQARLGEV